MYGYNGFGGGFGNNNPFSGGFGELASDWAINKIVPGGLNSKFHEKIKIIFTQNLRSNGCIG